MLKGSFDFIGSCLSLNRTYCKAFLAFAIGSFGDWKTWRKVSRVSMTPGLRNSQWRKQRTCVNDRELCYYLNQLGKKCFRGGYSKSLKISHAKLFLGELLCRLCVRYESRFCNWPWGACRNREHLNVTIRSLSLCVRHDGV